MDKQTIVEALKEFYTSYVYTSVNGSFQVFQSFSYGEMTIALLLALSIVLFTLKWIWEALR